MVSRRKTLRKILAGSRNIQFDEFTLLLTAFGFVLKRVSGSHHIFKHPNLPVLLSVQPDANGQAKLYQIRQFMKLVEEYRLSLEQESETDEESDE